MESVHGVDRSARAGRLNRRKGGPSFSISGGDTMKRIGKVSLSVVLAVSIVFVWSFAVPVRRAQASEWVLPVVGGLGGFASSGFALAAAVVISGLVCVGSGAAGRVISNISGTVAGSLSNWWSSLTPTVKQAWDAAGEAVASGGQGAVTKSMESSYETLASEFVAQTFLPLPFPGQWTISSASIPEWNPVGAGPVDPTAAGILAAAFFVATHASGAKLAMWCHRMWWFNLYSMHMRWALISERLSLGTSNEIRWYDSYSGMVPFGTASLGYTIDGTTGTLVVPSMRIQEAPTNWVDCPYSFTSVQARWWSWEHKVFPAWKDWFESKEWCPVPADWTIEKASIGDAFPVDVSMDWGEEISLGPDIAILQDGTNWKIDGIPMPEDIVGPVPIDPPVIDPPSGGDTGLLSDIKDVLSSLAGAIAAAISAIFVGDFSEVDWSRLEDAMSLASTKFPFCLPWDLGRFAGIFDVPEQAVLPSVNVEWPAVLGGGSFTMQIGAGLEGIFSRIKWLLLIVWDIGLINWGRKWWTGGGQA